MIKKASLKLLLLQRALSLAAMVSSFAIVGAVCHAQGISDVALPPVARDATRELATKITQPFVFAAVGDVWATTRPNAALDDPRLQSLSGVMRSADMTYANMEGPIIDYGAYNGPRVGSSKTFVGELKNMGIRIMTTANNHAMDAGPEGMFMTNRLLDEAGIARSGTGKNLTEARRPATFPQRSPPSLLTTAACGGLRSTPDCRPRRALLHLSYSCAWPFGPAMLVTQDPKRTSPRCA